MYNSKVSSSHIHNSSPTKASILGQILTLSHLGCFNSPFPTFTPVLLYCCQEEFPQTSFPLHPQGLSNSVA